MVGMGAHLAVSIVFHIFRHVRHTIGAEDDVAQEVDPVFGIVLVVHRLGLAYLLTAVEQVLGDNSLVLAPKPLHRCIHAPPPVGVPF